MPNVGYETVGGTILNGVAGDHNYILLPAMPEAGTLDSISFYVRDNDGGTRGMKYFIADSSGNLIEETATFTGFDQVWHAEVPLSSVNLTNATQYIIGCQRQGTNGRCVYDTGQTGHDIETDAGTWSTINDPVASDSTISNARLSAYLTYTASATVAAQVRRRQY